MSAPAAPQGVRVHTEDATYEPDLTYVGVRDGDGVHLWHAVIALPLDTDLRVTIDVLPAKCAVEFLTGASA